MAKFVSDLDVNQNQIKNGRFETLASDPSTGNFEGRLFYNSTEKVIKWRTDSGVRKALHAVQSSGAQATALTVSESNGTVSITANLASGTDAGLLSATNFSLLTGATSANTASAIVRRDASGNFTAGTITATTVTGLTDPVNPTDAATKAYVDAARSGLDIKASVRAATLGPGTLASSFANGQLIDGVTLATGDRILIKNQTTGSENGIYTVNASGAPTRATDADTNAKVTSGMFTFVEQGSQEDSGWVLSTDGTITLGTTALTFTQFSGAGQITAGTGMTKTGNTLNVGAGTGITVNADDIQISATYAGQNTIVTLGTVTTGTWSASTILANRGGTGQTSYTVGDILYADTTTTLAKLADVATGNALISGGVGVAPSWGKIGLTTHVNGTLPIGNGGTGATAFTSNGVVLGGATLSSTAAGAANEILRVPSAGGAPSFGSINLASSSAVGSTILPIANGGTNASTAAAARTNLDVPRRYSSIVPSGSTTATVVHNLGTKECVVEVYEETSGITVYSDVTRTDANTVNLGFSVAPSASQYRVVILALS